MEKEVFKALTGGLGLAGKLVSRSVDEVSKAVKGGDEGAGLLETGLYHAPAEAGVTLSPRVRWLETQASSRLGVNLLRGLTMSAGEKEFIQGLSLILQGRYGPALDALREAARKSESKMQVTDAYFVLGSLLLQLGQSDEASRHLKTALMAQQGLGRGLKKWCPTFHLSLALTPFSCFVLAPDLIGLTVALSLSQVHRDADEAIDTLEQLLELVPGEPTALFFVNLLRYRAGFDRQVFQSLQRTLPDSNLHLAGLLLLGLSCARLGDPATARDLFRKAVAAQSLDTTLHHDLRLGLAHCSRLNGNPAEAEREIQQVLREAPDYVSFEQRWGIPLGLVAPAPEAPMAKPVEPEPVAKPVPAAPAAPAQPVVLADGAGGATRLVCEEKGIEVALSDTPLIIGREADVSLVGDTAASRQHAQLTQADGDFWVEDLGSTNGTWVNGHRIRRRVELHRGDVVEIGEHRFKVC